MFRPRRHIFYSQRVMDVPDGLPKWSGLDKKSELIEDSPPEDVQEEERDKESKKRQRVGNGSKD